MRHYKPASFVVPLATRPRVSATPRWGSFSPGYRIGRGFGYSAVMHRLLCILAPIMLAAGFLLTACAPQTAAERAYFEQKKAERDARDSLRTTITDDSLKDADIVNMVISNAAPDGNGINDDWLKRQIGQVDGQILFPRWKVMRHGPNKYDAQYSFSIIDAQNRLSKRGYQWSVDAMVKLVGPPRELELAAPANSTRPDDAQQREKTKDKGFGLE